jgi:hypothetical protein
MTTEELNGEPKLRISGRNINHPAHTTANTKRLFGRPEIVKLGIPQEGGWILSAL